MATVIVVTSGKGGVGKTTTSASFATGLAQRGHFMQEAVPVGAGAMAAVLGCALMATATPAAAQKKEKPKKEEAAKGAGGAS